MFESVRVRLALWHTATLAVLLVAFAAASYVFLQHAMLNRMDQYLEETASAFGTELAAERVDEGTNSRAISEAVREFRFHDLGIAVYDSSLHEMASSLETLARRRAGRGTDAKRGPGSAGLPDVLAGRLRGQSLASPAFLTLPGRGGGERVYAEPYRLGTDTYIIAVVQPLHGQRETLETMRGAFLIAIPLALLLAGLGGYFLARRSLSPIVAMSARAARIGATNLHERLPVANPRDELGTLASVFNDLLGRLAGAFDQQRRFMADAAHELRTPVAIMRGEADVALSRAARSEDEYREALTVIGDEGRHLSNIVNDLFFLAQADAGQAVLRCTELYLNDVVVESVRAVRSLAAQQCVDLCCAPLPESPCRGDEELLRRVLLNLLDNAIKYSGPGATVSIALEHRDAMYRISVCDTGPGIPPEAQARLFERFYRVDGAHARPASCETGGAGLGLAIGRMVAGAHGGQLELVRSNEHGSEFALTLPGPPPAGV